MKKIAILIAAIAALSMLVASVSIADVPAPPVNQTIGFDDKVFNDFDEAVCNICHGDGTVNADRHHMLYGSSMPDGICSATTGVCINSGNDGTECAGDAVCDNSTGTAECSITPRECYTDADCVTGIGICSNTGDACNVAGDCPKQYQHPECTTTPYCSGTSAAANVPGSDSNSGVYGCLTCHAQDTTGGVTNFVVTRDCMACHEQLPNSPSVHHLDEDQNLAKAGNCTACHGDVVDNKDDGHAIPTYDPSLVTPGSVTTSKQCSETGWGPSVDCTTDADCSGVSPTSVCEDELHKTTAEAGSCDFCHAPGTDTASGVEVVDNHDTHHGTGVYKDRYGNTVDLGTGNSREICGWCHYTGYPHNPGAMDPIEIRTCENCHGMESLHNIQADSDASGTIVIGGELAGYGHVGEDTPGGDSDCWGCHGFSMSSASAPGSAIIAPTLDAITPSAVAAGTDTVITVTGSGFTNIANEIEYTAKLAIEPMLGGDVILVTPTTITVDTITASVNLPLGIYSVKADKDGVQSGAQVIVAAPEAIIGLINFSMSCGECSGEATITGSGFGEAPEGSDMSVVQDGITLTIVSWTDTEIVVSGANCNGGPITVNAFTGPATK